AGSAARRRQAPRAPAPVRACFFFQAEDGIRDRNVTGVQTCALPICQGRLRAARRTSRRVVSDIELELASRVRRRRGNYRRRRGQIGRASCRERVEVWEGGGSV